MSSDQSDNNDMDYHADNEKHIKAGEFIKSAVYGGLDGLITTLNVAISSIAAGAVIPAIVALGFASLFADGISMAVADYLATKSDEEFMKSEEQRELKEIEEDIQAEQFEMIKIYSDMGLEKEVSQEIVSILSSNTQGFLKVMMIEELQLIADEENPIRNSLVTFFSFIIFGLMPLIPFLVANIGGIALNSSFIIATICIAVFFLFILGFAKSFVTSAKWYVSTIETILIGAISAGASYGVGALFGQ